MGRAQTDLEPTPRYFCHGKQEQMPPQQGSLAVSVQHSHCAGDSGQCGSHQAFTCLEQIPTSCRGDAASGRVSRAIPQLHPLCNSSIPAARGTDSPWEGTHHPCPSSLESFNNPGHLIVNPGLIPSASGLSNRDLCWQQAEVSWFPTTVGARGHPNTWEEQPCPCSSRTRGFAKALPA